MTIRKLSAKQLREVLPAMPFNNLIGVKLTRVHANGVTIECAVKPSLLNGFGVLHGGVCAALVDTAVGIAINRHFGGRRPITTVELKINYFRPVSEGKIYARAHLVRVGSTICVGRVDLSDSQKNLAGTAIVTYMLLPQRPAV